MVGGISGWAIYAPSSDGGLVGGRRGIPTRGILDRLIHGLLGHELSESGHGPTGKAASSSIDETHTSKESLDMGAERVIELDAILLLQKRWWICRLIHGAP